MSACRICPRSCGADRDNGAGFCGVRTLRLARADLHFFEEPPISGTRGSGTVFFCGCSLRCVFCQNYAVSRNEVGKEVSVRELAKIFRTLEERGAHNLNLVTPTHYISEIEEAMAVRRPGVPVVWNTHSYETAETVERAGAFADVFLPDLKYFSPESSERYAGVRDYFPRAIEAIRRMRELREDRFGADGLMTSGVIVRHLILPMNVDETFRILDAVARELPGTRVSLMAQYTPFGELKYPELRRRITAREYARAVGHMRELGLDGYVQGRDAGDERFIPDWDLK